MCVLTTAKRVGGLQRFKRSVLTTAMRVVDLQSFGECVSTTVKPLGGCRAMESVY